MGEEKVISSSGSTLRQAVKNRLEFINFLPAICFLGLAAFYIALFGRYRAYEIDNPWYLSFSRNYWVDHFEGDRFLNGVFPDGMGGTVVFGRLAALLQGIALHRSGWSAESALCFSVALVLMGLVMWYCFLCLCGWSREKSSAFIVALGLCEPFLSMANRFRFEPVSFVLFSAAFLLVKQRSYLLAIIVSFLAIETEPAAAITLVAVILLVAKSGCSAPNLLLKIGIGGIFFSIFYLSLHPDIVGVLQHTDWHRGAGQRQIGGFLRAYFFERKRHLPEFFLFVGVFTVYLRNQARASALAHRMAEVTGLVCLFSFVMNWPTPAYMIFFFPPALVVAAEVIEIRWKNPWLLPAVMAALMVPQYCAVAYLNLGESYRPADIEAVNSLILRSERRLNLIASRTEVMGDYSLWFAHPAHYRALAKPTISKISAEDLFLCFDGPIRPVAMVDQIVLYCGDVRSRIAVEEIDQTVVRGHLLRVLVPARLKGPQFQSGREAR